jgi:alkylated DNA repair protein alkB family protein 5
VSESDVPQGTEDSGSVEEGVTTPSRQLSVAEREQRRLLGLKVRKDFMCMERVDGRLLNVVEGLELHMGVFSAAEQTRLVNMVYDFQTKGRQQQLRERTYSEPRKWMRGKGRITIQFGCCYNYATVSYFYPSYSTLEACVHCMLQAHCHYQTLAEFDTLSLGFDDHLCQMIILLED